MRELGIAWRVSLSMTKFTEMISSWSRFVRVSIAIVAAVVILVVLAAAVWTWLRAGAAEPGSNGETLRTVGLLIGGFIALCFGIWRASVAERQSDAAQKQVNAVLLQADTAQKGLLNDRYQRGAEMLGSEILAVRLGGIYALQQLAEEHPSDYHILIMRLLSAFIRNPTGSEVGPIQTDPITVEPIYPPTVREDVQAAVLAIGLRGQLGRSIEEQAGFTLDLRGSDLGSVNMQNCSFGTADLSEAQMTFANLICTDFSGAMFHKTNLYHATLDGADCSRADFSRAWMKHCKARRVNFRRASFFTTNLSDTVLESANLSGTKFHAANFAGASLEHANLTGAFIVVGGYFDDPQWRIPSVDHNWAPLTQEQLDLARADLVNPPRITCSPNDPDAALHLEWRGPTIDSGQT